MTTDYHASYLAWQLYRRSSPGTEEGLGAALVDAQVDLNPHQVDAAIFAFQSPLSKGALLADEVGLGKTIEAGLVVAQRWAERKRRILVITPSNLRKQWHDELTSKFFLPCSILENKPYNAAKRAGNARPFETPSITICSYQFARSKSADIEATAWDLVVIDEAHRLRNVYKPTNVIANTLRRALTGRPKLLLTATPLQNSLLELYGLISFIDEHAFGDLESFREQFAVVEHEVAYNTLRARLKPLCHRTLRRQVLQYVKFTKRLPIVQDFTPGEAEAQLYTLVSKYLQRTDLVALSGPQRSLTTLVLRKLLASSTFAIAGALTTMATRLRARLDTLPGPTSGSETTAQESLREDYEALDETADEWESDDDRPSGSERGALADEVLELERYSALAASIEDNAKGRALLVALDIAFARAAELGARPKAIVFTESRRTQDYLHRLLLSSRYANGIVLFNGSNSDPASAQIYEAWLQKNRGTDRITGSRTADMRAALVDHFRDSAQILIATEAGAEGINLQFCSLVVNYDLPWNPQRIEQRIGRCHRYGQAHDVVVVNFVNQSNAADKRVFQLLSEKFKLFEGVFGASDEVLGAIESGIDFERRIAEIYQRCRHSDEIQGAFDALQEEVKTEISASMLQTRRRLLETFDDEVREKLRLRDTASKAYLNQLERTLMQLTKHELGDDAVFSDESAFCLLRAPHGHSDIRLGVYELPRRGGVGHLYRLGDGLAQAVLHKAISRELPLAHIRLDYTAHEGKISSIERLLGTSGWTSVALLSIEALERTEDHLIVATVCDSEECLDDEIAKRLLTVPGRVLPGLPSGVPVPVLEAVVAARQAALQASIAERNNRYFSAEVDKLDAWADDIKLRLERDVKDLDGQIRELRRRTAGSPTLEEKLQGQRRIKQVEGQRSQRRRELFEAQDQVDREHQALIDAIESKLQQSVVRRDLFTVRWTLEAS